MDTLATNPGADRLGQVVFIGLAVVAVAIADVFLKRAAVQQDLGAAMRSPWLWAAIALYLVQVAFFTLAFVSGWRLTALGALQTVLYGLIVLAAGVVMYREALTPAQIVGAGLAVVGVALIAWR